MFRNKKLFIFDLDGTVVDSTKVHAIAWQMAFEKQGISVTPDEIMYHGKGMGYADRIAKLQSVFPERFEAAERATGKKFDAEELMAEKDLSFNDALKNIPVEDFLVPGVLQLMLQIRKNGGIIAIASNGVALNVGVSLDHAQLRGLIDHIMVASTAAEQKPKPFMINELLRKTGIPPEQASFFGDNKADAQAAKAASVDFCGITCAIPVDTKTTILHMIENGAKQVVYSFEEILRSGVRFTPAIKHQHLRASRS